MGIFSEEDEQLCSFGPEFRAANEPATVSESCRRLSRLPHQGGTPEHTGSERPGDPRLEPSSQRVLGGAGSELRKRLVRCLVSTARAVGRCAVAVNGKVSMRDTSLTVFDNSTHLTVAACYEHLERIDDLIRRNGEKQRYLESREFFEKQLLRCMKRREQSHHEHFERATKRRLIGQKSNNAVTRHCFFSAMGKPKSRPRQNRRRTRGNSRQRWSMARRCAMSTTATHRGDCRRSATAQPVSLSIAKLQRTSGRRNGRWIL